MRYLKSITTIITTVILLAYHNSYAQNEALFERLSALHNSGTTFYNVDGIDFTSQKISSEFNAKNLKKAYRKYNVKKKDEKVVDPQLPYENFKVVQRETLENGLTTINVNYFVKNKENRISVFWFGYFNTDQPDFERKMIDLIVQNQIPKSCYGTMKTAVVNFAGRNLELGGNCNWMNINNIQCPYAGQMNWSVHSSKESAEGSIHNQLEATKAKNGGKVVSEEVVDVYFEGVATKAIKVHYDFTGVTSLLVSMSGGKYLTIYYVSEKIRGNYVSCVLSFWNNDTINPSGLPPLLEEVMRLEAN